MRTLKRILIVHPYGIGDLLFVTPVLRALRLIPTVECVDLLLGSRTKPVVEHNPHVNDIFILDKDRYHQQTWLTNLKDNLELGRKLRTKHYDLMLDFSLRRENAFFGRFFLGIPKCAGFAYKKRAVFHNIRYPLPDGFWKKHAADFYCDLAEAAGISVEDRFLEYFMPPDTTKTSDSHQKGDRQATNTCPQKSDCPNFNQFPRSGNWGGPDYHQLKENKSQDCHLLSERLEILPQNFMAVSPGGGDSWGKEAAFKRWPVKYFAELITRIKQERGISGVAILGSVSERELCEELQGLIDPPSVVLAGETTLAETAMVIKKSKLFIGNDGGLVHLAHALRVPLVAFYGPVPPEVYGPYPPSPDALAVYKKDLDCRPCYYKFRYNTSCPTIACLKDLSPDEALKQMKACPALLC